MAKLQLPEACCVCGKTLIAGDRIQFTRTATVRRSDRSTSRWDGNKWVHSPRYGPLEPRVSPTQAKDVQHIECSVG